MKRIQSTNKIKKIPLTNAQRQRRFKAKKSCEKKGYVVMIEDEVNRNKYNGCYYLAIKKDKYKCSMCSGKKQLNVSVVNENNNVITVYDNDSIDSITF